MKEHQKIREFFSKEQEERDERQSIRIDKKTSFPLVNKNLRH